MSKRFVAYRNKRQGHTTFPIVGIPSLALGSKMGPARLQRVGPAVGSLVAELLASCLD